MLLVGVGSVSAGDASVRSSRPGRLSWSSPDFFAILGLQTWGFVNCGPTEELRLGGDGSVAPCMVDAVRSKTVTVLAMAGVAVAVLIALRDFRQPQVTFHPDDEPVAGGRYAPTR